MIRRVWDTLDERYQADSWDARLAGARAAAEWTLGVTPVSPVTNERKSPELVTCRWESHTANMRSMGIGREPATDAVTATFRQAYARGAASWLFWWTGLEPLPGWLSRATPTDPLAS